MKFINCFFVLCLLMLVLTSCSINKSPDIIDNGTEVIDQKIEIISPEDNDLREKMPNDFSYNLLKPLISSKGIVNYQELKLPSKVNGFEMSIWLIFDNQRLLVVLYDDTPLAKSREIGFYNFVSDEYETLFTINNDGEWEYSVSICNVDESNILYVEKVNKGVNDLIGTSTLRIFNIGTMKDIKIHEYSRDYMGSSAAYANKVILHNGMVYYDEVEVADGKVSGINLFQFDIQNESITLVKKWAQNPTTYKGELFSVVKNDSSPNFYFQSIDEKTTIKLSERISNLTSTGTELYVINNKYLDEKNRSTVWNIENLTSDEELLTSSIAIDRLNGNSEMLTWTNYFPEKPIIFIKSLDKFIIFDDIEKGYFSYKLSDELCILTYSNDYNAIEYYIFTLNE